MSDFKAETFRFDLNARKVRITNNELLESLKKYAEKVNFRYFSTLEYDKQSGKMAHSSTIISRFGSWKKALQTIQIEGGRERKYSPEELIDNLETVWRELGYPLGKRQLSKLGLKISERPYKRIWGSVKGACNAIAEYHNGKISKEKLMNGSDTGNKRVTIPLSVRWMVLKRDNYTCQSCGQSPARNNEVELEIDHILPVSQGGTNQIDNLRTLCKKCNQGKKDK